MSDAILARLGVVFVNSDADLPMNFYNPRNWDTLPDPTTGMRGCALNAGGAYLSAGFAIISRSLSSIVSTDALAISLGAQLAERMQSRPPVWLSPAATTASYSLRLVRDYFSALKLARQTGHESLNRDVCYSVGEYEADYNAIYWTLCNDSTNECYFYRWLGEKPECVATLPYAQVTEAAEAANREVAGVYNATEARRDAYSALCRKAYRDRFLDAWVDSAVMAMSPDDSDKWLREFLRGCRPSEAQLAEYMAAHPELTCAEFKRGIGGCALPR